MKPSMIHAAALAATLLAFSTTASAQFSGPYAPANWTTSHLLDAVLDMGSVDVLAQPDSITLFGSDTGSEIGSEIRFTTTAAAGGIVSFDWAYQTEDIDGDPVQDPAGYFHNGNFPLSVGGAAISQFGSFSLVVSPGDVIGFWVGTTDNSFGPAHLTISNFSAPIPEPGAAALMALGLAGLVAWRTRRVS